MEKNSNKKNIVLVIVLAIITLIVSVGGTYAYFQANITQGNKSGVSITALNGLTLSFDNGNGFNLQDIMPGAIEEKTISVKLTNKRKFLDEVEYSIIIHVTENGFNENTGYLQYRLEGPGENDDTGFVDITNDSGDIVIAKNKKIQGTTTSDDVTDTYTLTMYYPNYEDRPQEQGGYFDGYIYVTTEHINREENIVINYSDINDYQSSDLIIGDILVIPRDGGDERFYYYKTEGDKKYFLAKYNIFLDSTTVNTESGEKMVYSCFMTNEALGDCEIQYSKYFGSYSPNGLQLNVEDEQLIKASVETKSFNGSFSKYSFSNNVWWSVDASYTGGSCLHTYEGSNIESFVNDYRDKIRLFVGNNAIYAKIMTISDLTLLKKYYTKDVNSEISEYEKFSDWNLNGKDITWLIGYSNWWFDDENNYGDASENPYSCYDEGFIEAGRNEVSRTWSWVGSGTSPRGGVRPVIYF